MHRPPETVTRCGECGAEVRSGQCDLGFDVRVDVAGLDAAGELGAILEGRYTCTWHTSAGVLAYRGPHAIGTRPAGTAPRQTVHAEHRCEETTPR